MALNIRYISDNTYEMKIDETGEIYVGTIEDIISKIPTDYRDRRLLIKRFMPDKKVKPFKINKNKPLETKNATIEFNVIDIGSITQEKL